MANTVRPMTDHLNKARFDDPALMCMVTLTEAAYMWNKSETAITNACLKRQISWRRAFTGGNILISYHSIVKHYGQPVKDELSCLLSK